MNMRRLPIFLLSFVAFAVPQTAWEASTSGNLAINVTGTGAPEVPGPSAALLASHNYPYLASNTNSFQVYNCVRNFYVNITTGNDGNDGSSGSPWQHLSAANTASRTGGDCINVAAGTYDLAGTAFNITQGGTGANANGYVVYRCETLDACIITSTTSITDLIEIAWLTVNPTINYVVIDGFDINGAGHNDSYSSCIDIAIPNQASNNATHHIWILNNIIHGCTQSGIQTSQTEFIYVLHNLIYDNVQGAIQCCQGSGISFYDERAIAGYSNTTADNALEPFHNIINWNVLHNNRIDNTYSDTDGNNISIDNNSNSQTGGPVYAKRTLIAFNVSYNSGGYGICLCANSGNVTMANNSLYNNVLDTFNPGTGVGRSGLLICCDATANGSVVINNISVAVPGAGILSSNNPVGSWYNTGGVTVTWSHNISNGNSEQVYNTGEFSCANNKCNPTNPQWMAVGTTTTGSKDTPPSPTNFALSGASPAVGYGQTQTYLSPQAVDVGACYHTLYTCP
jgi:hypothetical protein